MEQYICLGCGSSFAQPTEYREPPLEPGDLCAGEKHPVSPCCGEAFAPARACESCGVPLAEEGLCQSCRRAAVERFQALLEQFSPAEREALDRAYDGVALT